MNAPAPASRRARLVRVHGLGRAAGRLRPGREEAVAIAVRLLVLGAFRVAV